MARSRNHCCGGNATLRFVCIVEEHVTDRCIKISSVDTKMFLWRIYVASNNTTYLDLHVKCPIFLSHFKQIRSSSRNFRESHRFQIFGGNLSSGIRADRRRDRWADNDIDILPDYANALKNDRCPPQFD
jgi:hypothetical protein